MPIKEEESPGKRLRLGTRGSSVGDKGMCIFIQLGDNGRRTRVSPRACLEMILDPRRYLSRPPPRLPSPSSPARAKPREPANVAAISARTFLEFRNARSLGKRKRQFPRRDRGKANRDYIVAAAEQNGGRSASKEERRGALEWVEGKDARIATVPITVCPRQERSSALQLKPFSRYLHGALYSICTTA